MPGLIGQSLGRYTILELLGEGGMAAVYKARDTRLEREVAVKVIRLEAFPALQHERILKRFEREARALARLTHPNIVHINDYGEQDGTPYLVMDFLPGGTLKHRMGAHLTWQESIRLLIPVMRALQYAHAHGILHRDVKPSNILFTESGEPMLSDFGIAKLVESEETQTLTGTGAGIGTPEYMAPEQVRAEDVTPSADIWAFCAVLYELVVGDTPFHAPTHTAMLEHILEVEPTPITQLGHGDERLWAIIERGLAKDPAKRWASMGALGTALAAWLLERGEHHDVCGAPIELQWLKPRGGTGSAASDAEAAAEPAPSATATAPARSRPPSSTPEAVERAPSASPDGEAARGSRSPLVLVLVVLAAAGIIAAVCRYFGIF